MHEAPVKILHVNMIFSALTMEDNQHCINHPIDLVSDGQFSSSSCTHLPPFLEWVFPSMVGQNNLQIGISLQHMTRGHFEILNNGHCREIGDWFQSMVSVSCLEYRKLRKLTWTNQWKQLCQPDRYQIHHCYLRLCPLRRTGQLSLGSFQWLRW